MDGWGLVFPLVNNNVCRLQSMWCVLSLFSYYLLRSCCLLEVLILFLSSSVLLRNIINNNNIFFLPFFDFVLDIYSIRTSFVSSCPFLCGYYYIMMLSPRFRVSSATRLAYNMYVHTLKYRYIFCLR